MRIEGPRRRRLVFTAHWPAAIAAATTAYAAESARPACSCVACARRWGKRPPLPSHSHVLPSGRVGRSDSEGCVQCSGGEGAAVSAAARLASYAVCGMPSLRAPARNAVAHDAALCRAWRPRSHMCGSGGSAHTYGHVGCSGGAACVGCSATVTAAAARAAWRAECACTACRGPLGAKQRT